MGDNPTKFQHHPLKTVGEVVFTTISYISISKYLKNAAQKKKETRKYPYRTEDEKQIN